MGQASSNQPSFSVHRKSKGSEYSLVQFYLLIGQCQDPIKAFVRASRVWRVHDIRKFSGQEHGIDQHFPYRPTGNVMQPCLVCPIPGFNTPEEWDPNKEDWNNDFELVPLLISDVVSSSKVI